MNAISISQLKANPSTVISQADDYPVAVENRNKVRAYLIGKDLFEAMVRKLEDQVDAEAVREADITKGRPLEDVVKALGL